LVGLLLANAAGSGSVLRPHSGARTQDFSRHADFWGVILEKIRNEQKLVSLLGIFFYKMHWLQDSGWARLRRQSG
jgi:hypothetical protein